MIVRTCFAVAAALVSSVADPTFAQETDDDAELTAEELEAIASDAESAAQEPAAPAALRAVTPDITFILDVTLAGFSDEDELLQTGEHDPQRNGFNLQQLELALGKAVDPYFRLDGNVVFSEEGVDLEEIYATTLALPLSLQLRAGQFLTQIGRYNPTHLHTWHFADQPFAIGRLFGGEGNRGAGAELSWLTPLPWSVEIIGSMTNADGEESARSFYGADDLGVEDVLDLQATVAVKQFFEISDDLSVLFGMSAAAGPNSTGADRRTNIFGADLYVKYRPITRQSHTIVSLQTEWYHRRRQIPGDKLKDYTGYAELFWKFAQRWGAAARYEVGTPARTDAGQVGMDDLDAEWIDDRYRVSVAGLFWATEFSKVRVQTAVDRPRWLDDSIYSAFLSLEAAIGAHAAHKF